MPLARAQHGDSGAMSSLGAIVDAARQTDAWITTGGTDGGIMRLIGETAAKHRLTTPVIGVCSYLAVKGTAPQPVAALPFSCCHASG